MEAPVLYVHVADDGGILVVDGADGRSTWVTEADLAPRVDAIVTANGSLLLSREAGSVLAMPVIVAIEAAGARVVAATEVHPDARRAGRATALMAFAAAGAVDLVEDLLRRGADLEARDEDGYTALMYAANAGEEEVVRLLVDAGADCGARDAEGSTPLMFAAQRGSVRAVKRLVAGGADVSAARTAPDGMTAVDFAESNGHDRVAAILRSLGG